MSNIIELSEALKTVIPMNILRHYAEQKRLTPSGVCGFFVMDNEDWANRLFNDSSLFAEDDIIHDFVGLMVEDEHFVSRI